MSSRAIQDRREQVRHLTEKGMSCRAIADQLGVNYATISRDRSVLGLRGAAIIGLDGKVSWQDFTEPLPPKARRGRTADHLLYRFFDAEGVLLYVGITHDLSGRFSTHSVEREWWGQWAYSTVVRYYSRAALVAAERKAIKSEKPLHNIVHNKH